MDGLNGYICFYNQKRVEVYAATSGAAHDEVARLLKIKENKRHRITVWLAEKGGQEVVNTADF